jgi:probable addiction module antidote protein
MAKTKTSAFDPAEYLTTAEDVAEFLNEAFETNDPTFITKAIGIAAKAKGMTAISREANLSRENLYRSLSGNTKPEFGTIVQVLDAMGVKLTAKAKAAA